MAVSDNSYIATGTDMINVANEIREKAGLSSGLVFPDGWIQAIEGIETGGEFIIEHGTKVFAEDIVLKNTPLVIQHSVNKNPFLFVGISGQFGTYKAYQVAHILKTNKITGYSRPCRTDYDGYIMWGSSNGIKSVNAICNYDDLVVLGLQSVTINNPSGYFNVCFFAGSTLNWYVVGLK